MRRTSRTVLLLTVVALNISAPCRAQRLGMAGDNDNNDAVVFDLDTGAVVGRVDLSVGFTGVTVGDCAITDTVGVMTDFDGGLWRIDLTSGSLSVGTNPVPISNPGEDVELTPDEAFAVICDGFIDQPISVVSLASASETDTFDLGHDCTSVDVCDDGSVLVTSSTNDTLRRLLIDESGVLSDSGESLALPDEPNNIYCAPGSTSGIVVTRESALLQSFLIPGLSPVMTVSQEIVASPGRSRRMASCSTSAVAHRSTASLTRPQPG